MTYKAVFFCALNPLFVVIIKNIKTIFLLLKYDRKADDLMGVVHTSRMAVCNTRGAIIAL